MSFTAHDPPPVNACENLIRQLEALRQEMEQQAKPWRAVLLELPAERRQSGVNLLHYLALRSRDLRERQGPLACLGLSSLGCAEPLVLPAIEAVLQNLYLLGGQQVPEDLATRIHAVVAPQQDFLQQNTRHLLGARPEKRRTHIMVTVSSEAADDYLLVHQLVRNGMDCLRINCSHDDSSTWSRTIEHLRDAERATGRSCRILMDLGGPKLRINAMESKPAVLKVRPRRNSQGHVLRPARIWLYEQNKPCEMDAADANLCVGADWLARLKVGDRVSLRDLRASRRIWRIREAGADGCWAEAKKTAYVANGTVLHLRGSEDAQGNQQKTTIRNLPPVESMVLLRTGDVLFISGSEEPGKAAIIDDRGELLSPGKISLPIAEIYRDAHPGERVCFDDGRIEGMIEKIDGQQLQIRITHTRKPEERLTRDKGVNFPDTHLKLPALRAKDLEDLEFAARHADMIGLSFANCPEDVRDLREQLIKLDCADVGVVLKIETERGFASLPAMLLEAMKFPACGVMIARGDLGVEVGFERMAEVQEEIMWLCESAHVPVIWATQVLEGLTKRGHAARAEVTDAAMSQTAECVMLNKGPYIIKSVNMLNDILQRMQSHHEKKRFLLRKLRVASALDGRITPVRN